MTRWLAHLGLVVGGFLAAFALLAAIELALRAAGVPVPSQRWQRRAGVRPTPARSPARSRRSRSRSA